MSKLEKKLVNVEGLKVRNGKTQHLVVGHVYPVTAEKAEILIKTKQAVKTSKPVSKKAALVLGGKADAGKADAGKADAGKADAGKADAGKADAGKADAGSGDEDDLTK